MISLDTVNKSYGDTHIVRDVSFSIKTGEKVSLIGPGSSGKTTILKTIVGLIKPESGQVKLLEEPIHSLSINEQTRLLKRVGMAFQQGGLFDFMTVKDNIIFALEHMTDSSRLEMEERIKFVLNGVKLFGTESKFPYELSGGMQKRVGIARALSTYPDVAVFDDPTAGLDPVTSSIILKMILELGKKNEQTTLLIATSNVEIALRFADRVILINEGRVEADGNWRDLLLNGSPWVKRFLSVRLIGLDLEYAHELNLPEEFIAKHWQINS